MNTGWIIFGLCILTQIGATLPLLHERRRPRHDAPPAPKPPPDHHES